MGAGTGDSGAQGTGGRSSNTPCRLGKQNRLIRTSRHPSGWRHFTPKSAEVQSRLRPIFLCGISEIGTPGAASQPKAVHGFAHAFVQGEYREAVNRSTHSMIVY